jgi:hypothetical protein
MNFDQSFKEVRSLMLKEDLKLYEAISKTMIDYRLFIYKEKYSKGVLILVIDIQN